jgi:hypothetical protein
VDEPGRLKVCARDRSLLVLAGCLLFIAALFPACTFSEPKVTSPATPASFSETVKNVAQTRALQPKQDIKLAGGASPGSAPAPPPIDFYNGAPLLEVERAYKIIGLLPNATDFGKAVAEYRLLERFITYDRATSSVSWTAGAPPAGAPLANLNAAKAREFAPVFAIVQALQEQHFSWRATIDEVSLEDRRSAFRALATGDATLTLLTMGVKGEDLKLLPAQFGIAAQVAGEIDKLAAGLPDFLRRQLTFPYRHGSQFVYWAFRSKGWQGVDGLYANPPHSTSEILHPEKYFVERETPLRFFPAQLLRRFRESPIVEQTLGEDAIMGLLMRDRSTKLPADIAAGWRGDQLFAFPESGNPTIIWFSSWRTEDQAQDFFHAYRGVLEARHRVRFDAQAGQANGALIARARDQRGWLLQKNGTVVLLASTSAASRLTELAAEAWKDLEIDKETMEMRFESARVPAQLSASSR